MCEVPTELCVGKGLQTLPPQWAYRAEHQTKEDYSQALRSSGFVMLRQTYLRPVILSIVLIYPIRNGYAYNMYVLPLCFGSTRFV